MVTKANASNFPVIQATVCGTSVDVRAIKMRSSVASMAGRGSTRSLQPRPLGDHDLVCRTTAEETHAAPRTSKVIVLARSGHMTFVDQMDVFLREVSAFLDAE